MIRSDARQSGSAVAPADVAAKAGSGEATPSLIRIAIWGGTAAACLLAVALATLTDSGQARIADAYAALAGSTGSSEAPTAQDREIEARRMAETLRNLSEDRDGLLARMTALERNYEDVTGSIGKLANAAKVPPSPAAPPASAPVASAPAVTPASGASASAAAQAPAGATVTEPETVSTRSEFGVDIGGAPTLAALRAAWDRARRNHASLLDGLRPVIAVRDGRGGQVELRLVAGPIGNAAAAAKLCAALAAAGMSCQPTMFEGQRLAVR